MFELDEIYKKYKFSNTIIFRPWFIDSNARISEYQLFYNPLLLIFCFSLYLLLDFFFFLQCCEFFIDNSQNICVPIFGWICFLIFFAPYTCFVVNLEELFCLVWVLIILWTKHNQNAHFLGIFFCGD